MLALAALYFGREHVVVGDKEQVTPDAVGQRLDQVQRLIDTNLQGIPNSHLYDGQTSIYDLAETAFGGVVALREHFRCVPEIIQFSNDLSYNLTIRPLREPSSLIPHRVHGFRDGNRKTNEVEAEEIATLVVACLDDPAYALNEFGEPTTFGVISLLGIDQALLIEEMLRKSLSPSTFAKHRLLCGNAAQFQGDERDVVFLSMVDGPPDDGQLPRLEAGPRDLYKKRYNVAVSRARNQLWVVHSLDPTAHLQPRDLRRRLIEHARDPEALLRAASVQGKRTDSVFEKLVLQRLLAAGYRVQTQWSVGAYRIDLVVEGSNDKLAVECDGEKWHTPEQLQQDIERQAILERTGNGWKFVRIRGSVFFRNPDAAMAPVFVKLDQLGIEPLGQGVEPANAGEVVERIKRQAEALRAQWQQQKEDAAFVGEETASRREDVIRGNTEIFGTHSGSPKSSARSGINEAGGQTREESPRQVQFKNVIAQRAASGNRILEELTILDATFRDRTCAQCGHAQHLAITNEGVVLTCKECKKTQRVDADILQHLADRLMATCFSCSSGKLKSTARPFGNILMCQNPGCGRNNYWQGLSERISQAP
ncbi:MAG: DUF559 domain-containing protein [Deltaproteobacteria bacterium]|nr:DUF559 domain-containing protein [Deltaproteobacteria bacterium]